jgi:thioredoxin 1
MASVKEVTDGTFEQDVLKSSMPVMVDFWAPWCGPCHMVSPLVEELAGDFEGEVSFFRLNTDENPTTASSYGIRAIPTLMIFKEGEPVGQIIGFRPKAELKKQLENAVGLA